MKTTHPVHRHVDICGVAGGRWRLASGLARAVRRKHRHTDMQSWGGIIGVCWMAGYFATVIPIWVYVVVQVLGRG